MGTLRAHVLHADSDNRQSIFREEAAIILQIQKVKSQAQWLTGRQRQAFAHQFLNQIQISTAVYICTHVRSARRSDCSDTSLQPNRPSLHFSKVTPFPIYTVPYDVSCAAAPRNCTFLLISARSRHTLAANSISSAHTITTTFTLSTRPSRAVSNNAIADQS